MMGYYNGTWDWEAWLLMAVTLLASWALIAWLVVTAVRAWGHPEHRPSEPHDAQRILDELIARGEITEDEYQRARSVLNPHQGQHVPR